jgi:protein-disulfide isomerase
MSNFLVKLFHCLALFFLLAVGLRAWSQSGDLNQRVERQVRSYFSIPSDMNVTVGQSKPSEFAGYDSVTLSFGEGEQKQTHEFLLSRDGNTLIEMTKLDLRKDPYADVLKKIDIQGRPVRGNKNAKVVVVSYNDFECPFCSRIHQTIFPELLNEYGDRVEFVYKDFPLDGHPWARHAAIDANCVAALDGDAYWDLADYLQANQKDVNSAKNIEAAFAELDRITTTQAQKRHLDLSKVNSCIQAHDDSDVKLSIKEGEAVGVNSTPTLFVNGEQVAGIRSAAYLRTVLDRALQQAGVPPPVHSR